MSRRWSFWIDRGGTFTDCVGRDPDTGALRVTKVLSSDRAAIEGIRRLLELDADAPLPDCDVRLGTTVATNALLERRGVPFALVTDRGLGDVLRIGSQARPDLFALDIRLPEPLTETVLELGGRMGADGTPIEPLGEAELQAGLHALRARGLDSLAICRLHGYRAPEHEQRIADAARALGFRHIAVSHAIDPRIGLLARGDTTAVDAYLTPLLRRHLADLEAALGGARLRLMQSSGGLTEAHRFRGPNAILSGPAGGVVALGRVAEAAGRPRAIGFDMGGTSTDVCRWEGRPDRVYEAEIAGVRVRAPMVDLHTVAAGGGSLCRYDGHTLTVGPESAGARPGPLAYGHDAALEPTITDVNLVLGRLAPDRFPFPLQVERAHAGLRSIAARLGDGRSAEAVAEGFFEIANAHMAEAIRRVSIARGHDARRFCLVSFGGAGGQHACALARRLGIREVLCHPQAGVLSAVGIGLADVSSHASEDLGRVALDDTALSAAAVVATRLEAGLRRELCDEGHDPAALVAHRQLELRYRGSQASLQIEAGLDVEATRACFEAEHARAFGYHRPDHALELEAVRVEVSAPGERADWAPPSRRTDAPRSTTRLRADGRWHEDVPQLWREALGPGEILDGPAIVLEPTATVVVDPGWRLEVGPDGTLRLEDRAPTSTLSPRHDAPADAAPELDPVQLEIFRHLFMSVAEQMGVVLQRSALSTNIRERLDFSCAVFDEAGRLIANAPHIPVHLGAMGASVRGVIDAHPELGPGDVFVTNDPARGGSHLPDITVVRPVHDTDGRLRFFVASRGHHADVGGTTPGSMPPDSRRLEDEGVVFRALRVVAGRGAEARFDEAAVRGVLESGPHPARDPDHNLADLQAQIAACATGARLLDALCAQHGEATVRAYMGFVLDDAAAKVSEALAALPDGERRFEDRLDDGTPIVVRLRLEGGRMGVDFEGTGAAVDGNLNAPRAVSVAAVLYVLRAMVGAAIPLNDGCLRPIELRIPPGSILDPPPDRAVAGGNVETSQRVVDVLLGALGLAAASQGTMNNLSFGDARFGYYETIAGGAGAGPGFAGASGVHTHMTNTRLTDPEVLESRFPVRVVELSLRRGSGGLGRYPGGDGLVRELEALTDLELSILSERRRVAPFGLEGGGPGALGVDTLDGQRLEGRAQRRWRRGTRLRIETPGGGGWGRAEPDDQSRKKSG